MDGMKENCFLVFGIMEAMKRSKRDLLDDKYGGIFIFIFFLWFFTVMWLCEWVKLIGIWGKRKGGEINVRSLWCADTTAAHKDNKRAVAEKEKKKEKKQALI